MINEKQISVVDESGVQYGCFLLYTIQKLQLEIYDIFFPKLPQSSVPESGPRPSRSIKTSPSAEVEEWEREGCLIRINCLQFPFSSSKALLSDPLFDTLTSLQGRDFHQQPSEERRGLFLGIYWLSFFWKRVFLFPFFFKYTTQGTFTRRKAYRICPKARKNMHLVIYNHGQMVNATCIWASGRLDHKGLYVHQSLLHNKCFKGWRIWQLSSIQSGNYLLHIHLRSTDSNSGPSGPVSNSFGR